MALLKKHEHATQDEIEICEDKEACIEQLIGNENIDECIKIVDSIMKNEGGALELVHLLAEEKIYNKTLISHIAALLSKIDPKLAPIDAILELMKVENAFVRNAAISILQDYGKEIKYYIVKYLIGDDRDLRIFAINVLGDVNFSESREMLVELLEKEHDINVAMTAVDYMRELGFLQDIPLLESLKKRFNNEPYVEFAVNKVIAAIKG